MLLINANILTLDPRLPRAEALLIRNGKVAAAGSVKDLRANLAGPEETVDLEGRTVLPGLIDAHLHLEYYSRGLAKVDCGTDTREECLQRIQARAAETPEGTWVLGHGWNQNIWPGGFGDAADLDRVVSTHPVYMTDKSLHSGWANQAALRLAGITENTADPKGGRIERDAAGKPTGLLFEAATVLVESVIPAPNPEALAGMIQQGQAELWKVGLTGVHDFDGADVFQALQMLAEAGTLGLRTLKSIPAANLDAALKLGIRSGLGSEFLRVGGLKLFADGGLGVQTAAMLEPYENSPSLGMLQMSEDEIFETGRKAVQGGISLAIHAIGDKAVRVVLNALERIRKYEDAQRLPHLHHRIEHVQLIHPSDAHRLAELGVTASMQPVHATSDIPAADLHWGARSATAYAWKLLLDQGTAVAFGSDAPVEPASPFVGMHAAVTRRRRDGTTPPEGWYPAQRIDLNAALQAYTTGAARIAGLEPKQGRLWTGYFADLVVLDEDPFKMPPDDLYRITPYAVMTDGKWRWTQG